MLSVSIGVHAHTEFRSANHNTAWLHCQAQPLTTMLEGVLSTIRCGPGAKKGQNKSCVPGKEVSEEKSE